MYVPKKTGKKSLGQIIIVNGVLGWGLSTSILFNVFMFVCFQQNWSSRFLLSIPFFLLSGVLYGLVIWKVQNKKKPVKK